MLKVELLLRSDGPHSSSQPRTRVRSSLVKDSSSGGPAPSVPLPQTVTFSQEVPLPHGGDDRDAVLRQLAQLVDELLHAGAGPGVAVQVIPQDEGALHQQLQLHQVAQLVEAQEVLLRFAPEKPAEEETGSEKAG